MLHHHIFVARCQCHRSNGSQSITFILQIVTPVICSELTTKDNLREHKRRKEMNWKRYSPKANVFSVVQPMYVVARSFGYWPFSVEFRNNSLKSFVRVTTMDWIRFVFAFVIYFICNWLAMCHYSEHHESYIEMATSELFQSSNLLMTVITISMDMVNRNVIWKIVLKFNKFDEEV